MKTNHDDVLAMIELAEEENDESAVDEVKELAEKVKSEFEEQKLATLLTAEYDSSNAILTFHAGRQAEPRLRTGYPCCSECT